jgi:hypothetical protein
MIEASELAKVLDVVEVEFGEIAGTDPRDEWVSVLAESGEQYR